MGALPRAAPGANQAPQAVAPPCSRAVDTLSTLTVLSPKLAYNSASGFMQR